jgi:hypothetical protein
MKSEPIPSDREVLAGVVERVTYQNAENGFCVVRVKIRGYRELVTLVGHAAVISAGVWVTASGEWVNNRTHGQQFKARFLKTTEPTSLDGIEKYLGSGMIRGIGPIYAKKLRIVADVVKAGASRLALDPRSFAAHSLRSGLVTTAVKRGVNLLKICDQTGHKSLEMLRVYCRDAELFVGNAATGLL